MQEKEQVKEDKKKEEESIEEKKIEEKPKEEKKLDINEKKPEKEIKKVEEIPKEKIQEEKIEEIKMEKPKPDTKEIALGLQCKRFKKMAKACSWQRDSYKLVPRQLFLNVKPKGEWKQLMFLAFSLHSKADKESMEFFFF